MISRTRRAFGAAGAVCIALALGAGTALAQQPGNLEIYTAPVIIGTPYVGATLTATGGAWRSPDPGSTSAWWSWWRCPNAGSFDDCNPRGTNATYTVTTSDRGQYVFVSRYVRLKNQTRWRPSARVGPVTSPPPAPPPPPPPAPTPTPTPEPTPAPVPNFDTAAAAPTPVPTSGEVLQQTATKRRVIRPFPVVRMRGRLTSTGARVTLLTVRAPRAAKVFVHCKGSCPSRRWSRTARKSRLTRVSAFERSLRSGTRITVTVTRRGYVGKRTTFVIRRGLAPRRTDRCLNSKGRVTRCPAGV